MKRVISIALSALMLLSLVLPCAALNVTAEEELTVCLTKEYEEQEEYITSLMTRLTIKFTYFDYPFQLH